MKNEFNSLKKVILAEPHYMKITEIINEVQKIHANENINPSIALSQHRSFAKQLEEHGVELLYLDTRADLHEQVFTRDIGFMVDELFCVSHLKEPIRKQEKDMLLERLQTLNLPFYVFEHEIEGGDVILHRDTIYVGVGNRTTDKAVQELKQQFPHKQVVEITLSEGILHLDCVFNILNDSYALLYEEGMTEQSFQKIKQAFTFLPISREEQETMGTNVLAIGCNKIFSLSTQKRINAMLRNEGFQILEQDFSEIIKSGGSFRCCTLPIKRTGGAVLCTGKQKKTDIPY